MTTLEVPTRTARLLRSLGEPTLAVHLEVHGPLALDRNELGRHQVLGELERSGLVGRGGGGFATHRKLRALSAERGAPILVANAMEGEPGSRKDAVLVRLAPHLVLDGVEVLMSALDLAGAVVCVPDDRAPTRDGLLRALAERGQSGSAASIEVASLPARYVAGEESALVAAVSGKSARPRYRPDKSVALSIGPNPALVHNVETLANIALIARHGADWFASVGTPAAPGTSLVTVSGDVEQPRVLEVEIGTPIDRIVHEATPRGEPHAVLVGGYGGIWLARSELATPYSPEGLRPLGGSMGAGVLVALSRGTCGVRETARIARFMAAESAGQCGPCLFGLPAIAGDLRRIADGEINGSALEGLIERCQVVDGRGACRHPDGVARMVLSALRAFADDVTSHLRGEPCAGARRSSALPFTTGER